MIEKLRRKVFWSILLSAAGVLFAILLAISVLKLAQTKKTADSILGSAYELLQPGADTVHVHGTRRGGKGKTELLRSVSENELGILILDSSGSIVSRSGCSDELEEDTVSSLVTAADGDADGTGRVGSWKYKVFPYESGTAIFILNAASLRAENLQTVLLALGAFVAACCLFALLARFLSRVIVKPVDENMQAQKRFVADASHELKTPLAVIDANAAVLEQTVGPNKWLDYIKEQTERMAGLVNELLQLSHMEEGNETAPPPEPFDAVETVLSASLPFESVAYERGVVLETELPEALEATGRAGDLAQIAAILIDNAIKHARPESSVRVRLSETVSRHGRKDERRIELRVSNQGEDIPPEALSHVFDRFYRVDNSRTHTDNSYGLGLAIAKGLADRNKADLSVRSQDGLTEFLFAFSI